MVNKNEIESAAKEWIKENTNGLNIGLVHSKLSKDQRDKAIENFRSGKTDVLVCTTVIEVGMDVPNASLMVIENAERLGLSQLHQLRGRVGRGVKQSTCILIYKTGLSENALKRIDVLRNSSDGFDIASSYLGRNLSDGVKGATINAISSSMPELLTSIFFLILYISSFSQRIS